MEHSKNRKLRTMDKKLIKNLISANFKRSKEDDFADGIGGTVNVFVVETETSKCKFWNSSDNSSFDLVAACNGIADKILEEDEDDVCEGTFSLGLKEIWFQIEEK
jgi:hypothetical protein